MIVHRSGAEIRRIVSNGIVHITVHAPRRHLTRSHFRIKHTEKKSQRRICNVADKGPGHPSRIHRIASNIRIHNTVFKSGTTKGVRLVHGGKIVTSNDFDIEFANPTRTGFDPVRRRFQCFLLDSIPFRGVFVARRVGAWSDTILLVSTSKIQTRIGAVPTSCLLLWSSATFAREHGKVRMSLASTFELQQKRDQKGLYCVQHKLHTSISAFDVCLNRISFFVPRPCPT